MPHPEKANRDCYVVAAIERVAPVITRKLLCPLQKESDPDVWDLFLSVGLGRRLSAHRTAHYTNADGLRCSTSKKSRAASIATPSAPAFVPRSDRTNSTPLANGTSDCFNAVDLIGSSMN